MCPVIKPRRTKTALLLLTILTIVAEAVTAIVVVTLFRDMTNCVTTGEAAT